MGLDPDEQEYCYEHYWNAVEKNTVYDVSSFARDWLAAIRRKTPAIKRVYTVFKDYVKAQAFNTRNLLSELLKYSEHYKVITTASSGTPQDRRRTSISAARNLGMAILLADFGVFGSVMTSLQPSRW